MEKKPQNKRDGSFVTTTKLESGFGLNMWRQL
jgi:hypothetical protein